MITLLDPATALCSRSPICEIPQNCALDVRFCTKAGWENLRHFVVLAREGTLSAAARVLGVDHATVARRVAALEADTGLKLIDRRARSYQLTDDGKRIAATATPMEEAAFAVGGAVAGGSTRPARRNLDQFAAFRHQRADRAAIVSVAPPASRHPDQTDRGEAGRFAEPSQSRRGAARDPASGARIDRAQDRQL
jgi:DNA-binding MarR family transcriptional regulator